MAYETGALNEVNADGLIIDDGSSHEDTSDINSELSK